MIHIPSHFELKALMEQHEGPCITLLLPAHRTGAEIQQDPLELRNALHAVEKRLASGATGHTLRSTQIDELLKPIQALQEDGQFWKHPGDGLAIFRSPQVFRAYWLPSTLKEHLTIADRFYLKPLLPYITDEGRFYVLALSQNDIRLLEGTHHDVHEVELPEKVPASLAEALKYDEFSNEVGFYSSSSGALVGKGGRRAAIFYGRGVGIDDTKDNLLRYFQQIDRGLHELLHEEHAPMVLAGVEYLLPIYREANTYPYLLDEFIPGNPDKLSEQVLHERAWQVVEPYLLRPQQEAAALFRDSLGTGLASDNISEIVPAASYGRIASLFVALNDEQWGTFDAATNTISVHETAKPGDVELLDLAARETVLHGGAVYAVKKEKMPGGGLVAGVFRY